MSDERVKPKVINVGTIGHVNNSRRIVRSHLVRLMIKALERESCDTTTMTDIDENSTAIEYSISPPPDMPPEYDFKIEPKVSKPYFRMKERY